MGQCQKDREHDSRLGTPDRVDRGSQGQAEEIKLVAAALNHIGIYVANRDHSEKELRFKLKKNYPSQIIDQALEQAREQRLLRDPSLIAEAVCQALLRKKKSYSYIRSYLSKKGLPTNITADEDIEKDLAKRIVESQFGESKDMTQDQKRKAASRLKSRGFSMSSIKSVLFS